MARPVLTSRDAIGLGLWIVGISAGLGALWLHAVKPAPVSEAPTRYPAGAHVAFDERPTWITAVSAHTTCARDTLIALASALDHADPTTRAVVLIEVPDAVSDAQYRASSAFMRASAIEGAEVVRDRGGHDAALFGVRAAGAAYFFGADGRLVDGGVEDLGVTALASGSIAHEDRPLRLSCALDRAAR